MKLCVIFCLIYSVFSLNIGDKCDSLNGVGKCSLLHNCPKIQNDFQNEKQLPTICGYNNLELIVCCPNLQESGKTERISRLKCKEYGDNVFELLSSEKNKDYLSINISLCPNNMQQNSMSVYAKQKQYPHMALLGIGPENNKNWLCSGSLISEKFILTVAHCLTTYNSQTVKWVRLGDLDFESIHDNSEFLDFSVKKIHRHPSYTRESIYNDIALLELDTKVSFSQYIRPACLYSGNDVIETFIGSGWALGPMSEIGNTGHLRHSKTLKNFEYDKCKKEYNKKLRINMKQGIDEKTMICVEGMVKGACDMSSGSALQTNSDVYCMYDIIGIASFGKRICSNTTVVYTKVSSYLNWIESIVWPEVIQM